MWRDESTYTHAHKLMIPESTPESTPVDSACDRACPSCACPDAYRCLSLSLAIVYIYTPLPSASDRAFLRRSRWTIAFFADFDRFIHGFFDQACRSDWKNSILSRPAFKKPVFFAFFADFDRFTHGSFDHACRSKQWPNI